MFESMDFWDEKYAGRVDTLFGTITFTINVDLLLVIVIAALLIYIWFKYVMWIPKYMIKRQITKMLVRSKAQNSKDVERWYNIYTTFIMKYGGTFDRGDLDIVEIYYLYYRDHRNVLLRPHKLRRLFPAQSIMYGVTFVGVITFCVFIGHILKHLSS